MDITDKRSVEQTQNKEMRGRIETQYENANASVECWNCVRRIAFQFGRI